LLLARVQRLSEAAESLRVAERVSPQTIDYPYALMTVLLRAGDREGARAAAQRVLRLDPTHAGAMAALRALRQ
jgi:cytochrome c-type biogenesis protein CcmH/NrfG